jgi:hypothetical protein
MSFTLLAPHSSISARSVLGAMSLLGFLFGPGLNAAAGCICLGDAGGEASPARLVQIVLVLSAVLGGTMMMGLARTLPAPGSAIHRYNNELPATG